MAGPSPERGHQVHERALKTSVNRHRAGNDGATQAPRPGYPRASCRTVFIKVRGVAGHGRCAGGWPGDREKLKHMELVRLLLTSRRTAECEKKKNANSASWTNAMHTNQSYRSSLCFFLSLAFWRRCFDLNTEREGMAQRLRLRIWPTAPTPHPPQDQCRRSERPPTRSSPTAATTMTNRAPFSPS